MGMVWGAVTLSDANIRRVIDDPPLVWQAIARDDPKCYESARRDASSSLLGRLFRRRATEPPPIELGPGEGVEIDIDKAWHGLHYLFTETAWEGRAPENVILGGEEIRAIDVGYGPPRVLSSDEVAAASEMMARLDDDALRARFHPVHMTSLDIYPAIWDRDPDDDDTLGYLIEYAGDLRRFFAEAARHSLGAVVFLQ